MSDYVNDAVGYAKLVVELQTKVQQQDKIIRDLHGQIEIQNQIKLPLSVVKQVTQLESKIDKLENDLKYYKRFVPQQVIEERENKGKSTRGSLSATLKNNK